MQLAFLSDIHGNYYALKAVLEYLTRDGQPEFDRMICLGDVLAGHGGNQKVIDLLDAYNVELIRGNHDGKFVPWDEVSENRISLMKSIVAWEEECINPEIRDRLDALPLTISIPLEDGRTLLAFHSDPADLWGMANADFVETEKLQKVYADLPGDVFVYGHYHMNHVLQWKDKLLVNSGSVSGTVSFYPDMYARVTTMHSLPERLVIRQEVVAYDVEAQAEMDRETNAPFWQFRDDVKG